MAYIGHEVASALAKGQGLRFLNEEWNESISNGSPFTLRWNESLGDGAAALGVLRVSYPADGLIVYELVSNVTGAVTGTSVAWTPEDLENDLYTLWLQTRYDGEEVWAMSPPWTPIKESENEPHWFSALGAPIIVILSLYAIGVLSCFCHHRRKRERKRLIREAALEEATDEDEDEEGDGDEEEDDSVGQRHGSVDSNATANTLSEPEETKKPETWGFLDSPNLEARRPSDGTLTVVSSERLSEETAVASQQLLSMPPDIPKALIESEAEVELPRVEIRKNTRRHTRRARGAKRPKSW